MGRILPATNSIQFDWSGIELSATFEGSTSISALFKDTGNFYNIIIDNNQTGVLQTSSNTVEYALATGLESGTHTVTLTKRTEAFVGVANFLGFVTDDNRVIPVQQQVTHSRKLEIIGDSISCGYGNEGIYPCNWSPNTENSYLAYGPLLGRYFDAEYQLECWSGKGVVRNYGDPNITSVNPFPLYYPRTIANDATTSWNFTQWVPDAVLINLGTNDYSSNPTPPQNIFEAGYTKFINFIRGNYLPYNPDVQVFVACGPMIGNPCCQYVQNVVNQQSSGVTYVDLQGILTFPQDYGCDGHPNVIGHEKMFNVTYPIIQQVMNW